MLEGVLIPGRSSVPDEATLRPATPPPAIPLQTWNDARSDPPDGTSRRPPVVRRTLFARHHRGLQNAVVARTNLPEPGATSSDSQLATALEKNFGLLYPFLKEGRLTWSALQRVAAQPAGQNEERDKTIKIVSEMLKRPPLIDAIMSRNGDITRDSLKAGASALSGNSSPNEFSQDPFHAQGNARVVQALQFHFALLRDKTKDRTFLFEQHQYIEVAALKTVMQDPYDVDPQGAPVLEPQTGMPRPKYSELCVYTARNILERPGLLRSLEQANGTRLFGPPQYEGYLSNKSLDRWLEQDEARKAR